MVTWWSHWYWSLTRSWYRHRSWSNSHIWRLHHLGGSVDVHSRLVTQKQLIHTAAPAYRVDYIPLDMDFSEIISIIEDNQRSKAQ